jgi:hypothetical protein
LVATLTISLVGAILAPVLLMIPTSYLVMLIGGALAQIPRLGIAALGLPIAWAVMHLSWGTGFILGD